MTRCVHCGKPSTGQYSLAFEREEEIRTLDLRLCEQCLDSLRSSPDVRRVD